jgi:hypothetical protein
VRLILIRHDSASVKYHRSACYCGTNPATSPLDLNGHIKASSNRGVALPGAPEFKLEMYRTGSLCIESPCVLPPTTNGPTRRWSITARVGIECEKFTIYWVIYPPETGRWVFRKTDDDLIAGMYGDSLPLIILCKCEVRHRIFPCICSTTRQKQNDNRNINYTSPYVLDVVPVIIIRFHYSTIPMIRSILSSNWRG